MGWLGKVVGGTIGFALGGPLGAIAGAVFGHSFDISEQRYIADEEKTLSQDEQAQLTFFVGAFSMLAKLAKADGRICEKEIAQVESFINEDLQLNRESRQIAIDIFRAAADSSETFEKYAEQFYAQFSIQPRFLELMIDILLRVSIADGDFSTNEEKLIMQAVSIFRIRADEYLKIKSKYIGVTDKYHAILGCDKNDSDEFVKKQYRKLVTEYHPDKIASKGLPEEFSVFAAEKFREIQEAYEIVKKERGMK